MKKKEWSGRRRMLFYLLFAMIFTYSYDLIEVIGRQLQENLVRFFPLRLILLVYIIVFVMSLLINLRKKQFNTQNFLILFSITLFYEVLMFFYPHIAFNKQYPLDFAFYISRLLLLFMVVRYYYVEYKLTSNS